MKARRTIRPIRLPAAVADVRKNINEMDVLVQRRIIALQDQSQRLQSGLQATTELLDIADTLVANAEMGTTAVISNLYEIEDTGNGRETRLETLDKLIEVDLFQLGLMFELRAHTAEIGLLLNRVAAVRDICRTGTGARRSGAADRHCDPAGQLDSGSGSGGAGAGPLARDPAQRPRRRPAPATCLRSPSGSWI